ncbi:MAG: hypothetical protein V4668_03495 [Patescibacteria group bacterium]
MVRLNKNLLTEIQLNDLFLQFSNLINPESDNILREILGKEEQIMVAKRLATIILIIEGKSLYSISRLLKISPTTADKIKFGVISGRYEHILQRLGKSKKNYFAILDTIDSILHLGGLLPHYGNSSEGWKIVERLVHK